MRITFVLPETNMSGGIRVLSIYARKLQERGHEVRAVSVTPRAPGVRERMRALVKRGKWLRRRPTRSHFDGLALEHRVLPHSGPVCDEDVPAGDVVIATWWETAEWVWGLSAEKGAKAHFMQDYETWAGQVERVDETCRLPMPKIVIARWVWDLLERRFGQSPVALVPNSVDTQVFYSPPRSKQAQPTVGLTYATLRNKGTDISLEAYRMAAREVAGLKLVTFGSGELTKEMPLPAGAEYHKQVPDERLRDIYGRCDAWLFGTRIEGFGLPILEAMACRTPVIGTPAGAAPELLSKGGGILVPAENPQAMADAIVRVANMKEEEWQAMSDAAYRTATSYTWEQATDHFEQALKMVYRQRTSRALAVAEP